MHVYQSNREEQPQSIVVEPMAVQLNIPSKLVYGLREANAHVYHSLLCMCSN